MAINEGDKESLGALPCSRWPRPNPVGQIQQLPVALYSQQRQTEPLRHSIHCCDNTHPDILLSLRRIYKPFCFVRKKMKVQTSGAIMALKQTEALFVTEPEAELHCL